MSILLLMILSMLVSISSAELCNVTDLVRTRGDSGKYFSVEENDTCYLFALKAVPVKEAVDFCTDIGGRLTDVESKTNNILQKIITEEMTNHTEINTDYWIGLLWNAHLEVWYWVSGVRQLLDIEPVRRCRFNRICYWSACMGMNYKDLMESLCAENKPFICKIDLDCHVQEVTNESTCTPRCRDYIRRHKSVPLTTSSTTATTTPWDEEDTSTEATADTTDDGSGTQNRVVAECTPEEYRLVLILLIVLGGVSLMLFVTAIAMCARIVKYRAMLNNKITTTRISMVDILHADSPTAARRRRPGNGSSSHPDSTSELLYTNTDNNYFTPESEGGHAGETTHLIYQENGYSTPSEKLAPGNEASVELQPARVGTEYTLLDRHGEPLQQTGCQNVYGIESASQPLGNQRKISDTYETYANQQSCDE